MKGSTKVFALIGGLAGAAWLLLQKTEAAAPLKLVSFDAPDSVVAGEVLSFSMVIQSQQTQDITLIGHFIKSVGTSYDRANSITITLKAGQKIAVTFSIPMLPSDHWAWQWDRADPSRGSIKVAAHNPETLQSIADWTLKEITVYRS